MLQIGESFEFEEVSYLFLGVGILKIKTDFQNGHRNIKWQKEKLVIKALNKDGNIQLKSGYNEKLFNAIGIKTYDLIKANKTEWFVCQACLNFCYQPPIANSSELIFNHSSTEPKHLCSEYSIGKHQAFFIAEKPELTFISELPITSIQDLLKYGKIAANIADE